MEAWAVLWPQVLGQTQLLIRSDVSRHVRSAVRPADLNSPTSVRVVALSSSVLVSSSVVWISRSFTSNRAGLCQVPSEAWPWWPTADWPLFFLLWLYVSVNSCRFDPPVLLQHRGPKLCWRILICRLIFHLKLNLQHLDLLVLSWKLPHASSRVLKVGCI